ncbi:MAG: DUF6804 family protein [bacterium]
MAELAMIICFLLIIVMGIGIYWLTKKRDFIAKLFRWLTEKRDFIAKLFKRIGSFVWKEITRLITSLLLFLALAEHQDGYYQILRWVVCIVGAYTAYLSFRMQKMIWAGIFGAVAILFNPIAPIHLSLEAWQPIDVITGILFIVSIFFVRH